MILFPELGEFALIYNEIAFDCRTHFIPFTCLLSVCREWSPSSNMNISLRSEFLEPRRGYTCWCVASSNADRHRYFRFRQLFRRSDSLKSCHHWWYSVYCKSDHNDHSEWRLHIHYRTFLSTSDFDFTDRRRTNNICTFSVFRKANLRMGRSLVRALALSAFWPIFTGTLMLLEFINQ